MFHFLCVFFCNDGAPEYTRYTNTIPCLLPFSLIRDFRKQKHPRKRFKNFRQSYMLSTDRIEIHQSQPASMTLRRSEGHTSGCDWWISIRSVDNMNDWRKFWKLFRRCFCFPKSRINENGGKERGRVFLPKCPLDVRQGTSEYVDDSWLNLYYLLRHH